MTGQPSSPGICASELRLGGVSVIAGEATLCMDMAIAPLGHDPAKIVLCLSRAKYLDLVGRDLYRLKCRANSLRVIGCFAAIPLEIASALGAYLSTSGN